MARQLNRGFGFVSIRPAGALKFKASIVRDIDLFIGVIDQESIGAQGKPSKAGGRAELVEIRGRQPRLIRSLDNATGINTVDPAAIIDMKRQGRGARRCEGRVTLSLPAAGRLKAAPVRKYTVPYVVTELVITRAPAQQQAPVQQAEALLHVARAVRDMRVGARGYSRWGAAVAGVEPHIDLVVMDICARGERCGDPAQLVRVRILSVRALLQAR